MRDVAMLRWENDRLCRIAGYWPGTKDNGWTDFDPAEGRYQLMQFTGLLDKNGVEIYEGDIIRWDYERSWWNKAAGSAVFKVEWSDDRTGWAPFCECSVTGDYEVSGDVVAVVGNIYENPQLLTTEAR